MSLKTMRNRVLNSFVLPMLLAVVLITFLIRSDYLFKLLLIGDSGVGKSCLLLRFAVSPLILALNFYNEM